MTTTWNIDPTHSTVGFSIRHMMFSKVRGRFLKFTGAVQLDDDDVRSVDVGERHDLAQSQPVYCVELE